MKRALVIAYVCVALFTYGHAFSAADSITHLVGSKAVAALLPAAAWPLYWSAWLQSGDAK